MTTRSVVKKAPADTKPCPFCGNTEVVLETYQHIVRVRHRIFCANCLAMIDPGYAQSEHTVLNMWNERKGEV